MLAGSTSIHHQLTYNHVYQVGQHARSNWKLSRDPGRAQGTTLAQVAQATDRHTAFEEELAATHSQELDDSRSEIAEPAQDQSAQQP